MLISIFIRKSIIVKNTIRKILKESEWFEDIVKNKPDYIGFLESLTKHVKNFNDVWYSKAGGGGSRKNVTYPWTYYLKNGEMVMGHNNNHFPDVLYVDPKIRHLTDNPDFLDSFNTLFGENKKKKIVMDGKKWEKMKHHFSVFPDDLGTLMKESEGDFEWVEGLDVSVAEKEVKKPFVNMEYEWNVDADHIYNKLIEFGVRQPSELNEIGKILYDEFQTAYDNGYDSGRDSCDCDGCCDEYVYYDDHADAVREARDEGYDSGYDKGKEEAEDEISDLQDRVKELEDELEELRSRLVGSNDDLS